MNLIISICLCTYLPTYLSYPRIVPSSQWRSHYSQLLPPHPWVKMTMASAIKADTPQNDVTSTLGILLASMKVMFRFSCTTSVHLAGSGCIENRCIRSLNKCYLHPTCARRAAENNVQSLLSWSARAGRQVTNKKYRNMSGSSECC